MAESIQSRPNYTTKATYRNVYGGLPSPADQTITSPFSTGTWSGIPQSGAGSVLTSRSGGNTGVTGGMYGTPTPAPSSSTGTPSSTVTNYDTPAPSTQNYPAPSGPGSVSGSAAASGMPGGIDLTGVGANTSPLMAPSMQALMGRGGGGEGGGQAMPSVPSSYNTMLGVRSPTMSMRQLRARAY